MFILTKERVLKKLSQQIKFIYHALRAALFCHIRTDVPHRNYIYKYQSKMNAAECMTAIFNQTQYFNFIKVILKISLLMSKQKIQISKNQEILKLFTCVSKLRLENNNLYYYWVKMKIQGWNSFLKPYKREKIILRFNILISNLQKKFNWT